MIEKKLDVINKLGLHARAAAKVVSVASRYDSSILVLHKNQTIDAKSIMGLLMLAACTGSEISVECSGPDADAALEALQALVARKFDEED